MSRRYGEEHKKEEKVYIQEYNGREVDCEVCGSKVRKFDWFRNFGTAKHRDGVETVGGGGDIGGQGKEAEGRSWSVPLGYKLLLHM